MNYKKILQDKFEHFLKNKKFFYSALAVIILIIAVAVSLFILGENNKRSEMEKAAQLEKQMAAQALIEQKKAIFNRATFFLQAPAGARGGMDISNYWEGSYRISDTMGKKMTATYIKNSATAPIMYVRYDNKKNFKLESGEVELKTNSSDYAFAYYFYGGDAYQGGDKEDFSAIQEAFKKSLDTFSIF